MDDAKWERAGNLGGILFVVLIVVTIVLGGSTPKTSDAAGKIAKYFVDHGDDIKWAGFIGALASVAIFFWLGSVWRLVRRAEGGVPRLAVVALAGVVLGSAMGVAGGLVTSAMAMRGVAGTGGLAGTKFFYTLSWMFTAASAIGIAVFVSAFSIAIIRSGILPKLLGWFGELVALVLLVGSASIASENDTLMVLVFVGLTGALIFVLAASILMLMRTRDVVEVDVIVVAETSAA